MTSKIIGIHVASTAMGVPAGSFKPGALVAIYGNRENIGLITGNVKSTVDLVSLNDQSSWSDLAPHQGPLVVGLPVGSQIILEATSVEINEETRTNNSFSASNSGVESEDSEEAGSPMGEAELSGEETLLGEILRLLNGEGEDGFAPSASDSEEAEEGLGDAGSDSMTERYFGFVDLEDVLIQFEVGENAIVPAEEEVILATYSQGEYEGDAFVLFKKNGVLYEVNASHCSCYGLEGQWEPEVTSLGALAMRSKDINYGFLADHGQEVVDAFWSYVNVHGVN